MGPLQKRTLSRIFDLDARGVDRGVDYWERGAGPLRLGVAHRRHTRRAMSALDDRRRLVSDEPPGATFASPNGEVAIVNVHDDTGHQDLCRHQKCG